MISRTVKWLGNTQSVISSMPMKYECPQTDIVQIIPLFLGCPNTMLTLLAASFCNIPSIIVMLLQHTCRRDSKFYNEIYLIAIHHSFQKLWLLETQPWKSAWSEAGHLVSHPILSRVYGTKAGHLVSHPILSRSMVPKQATLLVIQFFLGSI